MGRLRFFISMRFIQNDVQAMVILNLVKGLISPFDKETLHGVYPDRYQGSE